MCGASVEAARAGEMSLFFRMTCGKVAGVGAVGTVRKVLFRSGTKAACQINHRGKLLGIPQRTLMLLPITSLAEIERNLTKGIESSAV